MTVQVNSTEYGRASLEALRKAVASAKTSDAMAAVTILVPNNLAGIVARRYLAGGLTGGHSGVAGIYISTLPRLAEQLAAPRLAPRRPATRPILASAWRAALDTEPGIFASVVEHPATIRALVRAHTELRDLSESALDALSSAGALASDVIRLHRRVTTDLRARWYDTTDLLIAGAELVDEQPRAVLEQGQIVLYLPQALTQADSRFATALAQCADTEVVAGVTRTRRGDDAVRRSLLRLGAAPLEEPGGTTSPAVASSVLHASDSDDEVRCVVRAVVEALSSTPAHRIAILYTAVVPYARVLHEQLSNAGVQFNGPGTRPVHERAVARGLLALLGLQESNVARADFFRAASEAPMRAFSTDRVPVARWERISRLAGIVGGDDWASRLQTYIDEQQSTAERELESDDPWQGRIDAAHREVQAAQALRDFIAQFRKRLAEATRLSSWAALSSWALQLFHDLYGEPDSFTGLPPPEQYAAAAVESTLRSLASLDEFEPSATVARLREVLELELEGALPRVGKFGEGVFVGPVASAVGLEADRVFIVGLAEDTYPGRLHEDALLSEEVRNASLGELVGIRERLDANYRHLLAAFEVAPDAVACFPRGDLRRSTGRLPSRWLLPTIRDFADNKELPATDWDTVKSPHITGSASYAAEMLATERLATEQEWRTRAVTAGHRLADGVVEAALDLITSRASKRFTRHDGNLSTVSDLPDYSRDERTIPPTSLEAYASCPHRYFVERLLRVKPLEQPEAIISISAMDIGNLIHESMDDFVKEQAGSLPSYGEPWSQEQRARLIAIATAKAQEFEKSGLTGHPLLWKQEHAQVLVDLELLLTDDDSWRRQRDAKVVASELVFGRAGADPVPIEVSGGRVLMAGSADKIDETRDGKLLVTDIKSGSARTFQDLKKDPVAAGTKLQLPVYAHAARQLLGADEVEAQYWFVRRKPMKRISLTLDGTLETTYAATIGTLVAGITAGHFPLKPPDKPDFAWVQCPYCNPDGLGHGEARERWLMKRHDAVLTDLVALIDPPPERVEPTNDSNEATL